MSVREHWVRSCSKDAREEVGRENVWHWTAGRRTGSASDVTVPRTWSVFFIHGAAGCMMPTCVGNDWTKRAISKRRILIGGWGGGGWRELWLGGGGGVGAGGREKGRGNPGDFISACILSVFRCFRFSASSLS